ncbi:hypothetical protein ACFV4T_24965 [Streptomyces sp. NPDC059755]|uniref:hypothetical protein n=1 Tax=Streptomyces sp. NPDC059755 TaxID=3346934 RepID=UPI00364C2D3F
MYLIHVRLRAPAEESARPDLAAIISSCAEEGDGLEHVSVHAHAGEGLTLGLFLLADSLATAEDSAARLSRRAVEQHPDLLGYGVVASGAVLVPGPWWDT